MKQLKGFVLLFLILGGLSLSMLGHNVANAASVPSNIFAPTWTESFKLYHQPHAMWLSADKQVGGNLPLLQQILDASQQKQQTPELVIYTIPLRDLGQSSEGGFLTWTDYEADNQLNAQAIAAFVEQTQLRPRVYIEPDALAAAIQYKRDNPKDPTAKEVYKERTQGLRRIAHLYKKAGALVYLDAAHSGWFDYNQSDIEAMANTLNETGIKLVDGLTTNVSNRQKLQALPDQLPDAKNEQHYLNRLLPLLKNKNLDVIVDTSRNGGITYARLYYLAADGTLYDNEFGPGRFVGHWEPQSSGDVLFKPLFGKEKKLSHLLSKEKYQFNPETRVLTAPSWLDAIGDVQLGQTPTNFIEVKPINRLRHIKPPDDCDGSLNCPPGESRSQINQKTLEQQAQAPILKEAPTEFVIYHTP